MPENQLPIKPRFFRGEYKEIVMEQQVPIMKMRQHKTNQLAILMREKTLSMRLNDLAILFGDISRIAYFIFYDLLWFLKI